MKSFKEYLIERTRKEEKTSSGPVLGKVQFNLPIENPEYRWWSRYNFVEPIKTSSNIAMEKLNIEREAMGMKPLEGGNFSSQDSKRLQQRTDVEKQIKEKNFPSEKLDRDISDAIIKATGHGVNLLSNVKTNPLNINNILKSVVGKNYIGSDLQTAVEMPLNLSMDALYDLNQEEQTKKLYNRTTH
jgi:hypothetical protein